MTMSKTNDGRNIKDNLVGDEAILKISKEIAIKFIEMGRVTPATFDETFKSIHATIKSTVEKGQEDA